MDATSASRGEGRPAPRPAAASPAPPGGTALAEVAIAATSSSGSSISVNASLASSLANARTSFSSRMSASTFSVYLLSALKPLSGTILEKSVSPDESSDSGGGGIAFTTAAAPRGGRCSNAGTRTMYTHSLSFVARRRSSSTASRDTLSAAMTTRLLPLIPFADLIASVNVLDARDSRAIFGPIVSSSSSASFAARDSASA